MSSFVQQFGFSSEGEPPEEHVQPVWIGPPEDELGVATPLNVVLGRSEQAVVALTQATSFTTGLTLSFLAQARDLDLRAAQTLFHEQRPFGGRGRSTGRLPPPRRRAAGRGEGVEHRRPAPVP